MDDLSMGDLVCLHLSGVEDADASPAPYEASTPGIAEAMDLGTETIADRIELVSALSTLPTEGLAEERTDEVRNRSGERNVYRLTDEGSARAGELREQLSAMTLTVRTRETEHEVPLERIHEHDETLARLPVPAVGALARANDGVYVVRGEEPPEFDPDEGRFVDREEELHLLRERLEAASEGRPQTVFVRGEPGVGKTTLVRELEADVRAAGGTFCYGRCHSDVAEPFQAVDAALSDLPPEHGEPMRALLMEVAEFEADDRRTVEEQRRARFFDVGTSLTAIESETPIVLFIDDMQWADRGTSMLFTSLARRLDAGHVLLIGACRPETAEGDWPLSRALEALEDDHYDWIDIDRFDREWTGELVRRLVGRLDVPEGFVSAIYEGTHGNPLFVTETVQHLIETGEIDPTLGIYPDDATDLDVPASVGESIISRFEALDENARRLIETASVGGDAIPRAVLEGATPFGEATFRDYTGLLVGSGIWRYESGQDTIYFQSGVVRETLRERLDEELQREYHSALADAYRDWEDEGDHAATIAHHRRAAGELAVALERYREAAERARDLYAHELAIDALNGAVDVAQELDDEATALECLEELGDISRTLDDFGQATRNYSYVRERSDDPKTVQRMYRKEAGAAGAAGELDDQLDTVEAGLELDDEIEDAPTTETVRLRCHRGYALEMRGSPDEALEEFREAVAIAEDLDDPEARVIALRGLGSGHMSRGEIATAQEVLGQAASLSRELEDPAALGATLSAYGHVFTRTKKYDRAIEIYHEAIDVFEEIGNRRGESVILNNLGIVYQYLDEDRRAIECFEEGVEIALAVENRSLLSTLYINLGYANLAVAAFEAAIEYARDGREIAEEMGEPGMVVCALEIQAAERLERGALEEAEELAREAHELATDIGEMNRVASDLALLGEIHRERGELESAWECFEDGLELCLDRGNDQKALLNRCGLVRTLVAAEALETAREHVSVVEEEDTMNTYRHPALIDYYRVTGAEDSAERLLERGLTEAREDGKPPLEAHLEVQYARLELDRNDTRSARAHLERAEQLADVHGLGLVERQLEPVREQLK